MSISITWLNKFNALDIYVASEALAIPLYYAEIIIGHPIIGQTQCSLEHYLHVSSSTEIVEKNSI